MAKVIVITGTSSGLGQSTAVAFARKGYKVYATMRDPRRGDDLRDALKAAGAKADILPLDLENPSTIEATLQDIYKKEGKIDALINNGAQPLMRSFEQTSLAEMQKLFNVNVFGAAACIKQVLPMMRAQKQGHIITVSSVGGLVGQPFAEIYCATKFAIEGLMESLATYAEPYLGIRCTLIEPAGIKTRMVKDGFAELLGELPLKDVYDPLAKRYMEAVKSRGSFDAAAQEPDEIASMIVAEFENPSGALRIPTSEVARRFASEKLAGDPDGTSLQKKVRAFLLGYT